MRRLLFGFIATFIILGTIVVLLAYPIYTNLKIDREIEKRGGFAMHRHPEDEQYAGPKVSKASSSYWHLADRFFGERALPVVWMSFGPDADLDKDETIPLRRPLEDSICLKWLKRAKNTKYLNLNLSSLPEEDLIGLLKRLPNLKIVDMNGTKAGDKLADHLAKREKGLMVELLATEVTGKGFEVLRKTKHFIGWSPHLPGSLGEQLREVYTLVDVTFDQCLGNTDPYAYHLTIDLARHDARDDAELAKLLGALDAMPRKITLKHDGLAPVSADMKASFLPEDFKTIVVEEVRP